MKNKVISLALAAVILLGLIGCGFSAVARHAAKEVQETQLIIFDEYLNYVANDPNLDEASKARRKAAVDAAVRAADSLNKALED